MAATRRSLQGGLRRTGSWLAALAGLGLLHGLPWLHAQEPAAAPPGRAAPAAAEAPPTPAAPPVLLAQLSPSLNSGAELPSASSAPLPPLLEDAFENVFLQLRKSQGIHLLTLPFASDEIDDQTTRELSDSFRENLRNTNRFVILLPPQETEVALGAGTEPALDAPPPCQEISCGVGLAKSLRAEHVLEGRLSGVEPAGEEEPFRYRLVLRLVDTVTNQLVREESLVFAPPQRSEKLFTLANQLARNLLQRGRVLQVRNPTQLVVGLGQEHGIRAGERMVVLRNLVQEVASEVRPELQLRPIALVKVLGVHPRSSQVATLQQATEIRVGDYVHAYQDPIRRVQLLAAARRSLDEIWRQSLRNLAPQLDVRPIIVEDDSDRRNWLRKRNTVLGNRTFWRTMAWGSAGLAGLGLLTYESSSARLAVLVIAGGFGVHSFLRVRKNSAALEELNVQGRTRGWLRPARRNAYALPPPIPTVQLHWRF